MLTMSGNGSYKPGNLEDGADWIGKLEAVRKFSFAMGIRESVRHLSGEMIL